MDITTWFSLPGAIWRHYIGGDGNETAFDRKAPSEVSGLDPHKLRLGGWGAVKGSVQGIISFDLLTGNPADPKRFEKIFLKSFFDDHPLAPEQTPCLEVFMQDPGAGSIEDATMRRRLRISAYSGIECFLPLKAHGGIEGPNGSAVGGSGSSRRMFSPEGTRMFQVQDDVSSLICYATHGTADESHWTPEWVVQQDAQGHWALVSLT